MKEIVLTIDDPPIDFKELIAIVKSLFQKGKTTKLSVMFQCEFKQVRENNAVDIEEPSATQQPATQQPATQQPATQQSATQQPATQPLTQTVGGRKRTRTGTVREPPAARITRQVAQEEQIEVATDNHIMALTQRL